MLQLRTGLLRFERLPCFGYPFVLASLLHLGLRDLPKGWPAPRHQACASRGGASARASGEPAGGTSASLTARASSRTRNAATLISWARVLVPEASPSIPSLRASSSVRSATTSSRLAALRANCSWFMFIASSVGSTHHSATRWASSRLASSTTSSCTLLRKSASSLSWASLALLAAGPHPSAPARSAYSALWPSWRASRAIACLTSVGSLSSDEEGLYARGI